MLTTNGVAAANGVVKPPHDTDETVSQRCYKLRVSTLAERLRNVLHLTGMNESQLSMKAELARGHVGLMLKRLEGNSEKDEEGGVNLRTLRSLARAGGVSLGWLASGEGTPTSNAVSRRTLAAAPAREANVPEEAIREILEETRDDEAKPTLVYANKMLMRGANILQRIVPDDPHPRLARAASAPTPAAGIESLRNPTSGPRPLKK